jgi:hypothetical protein
MEEHAVAIGLTSESSRSVLLAQLSSLLALAPHRLPFVHLPLYPSMLQQQLALLKTVALEWQSARSLHFHR